MRDKKGLRYLGRVGTGYGEAVTKTLVPALKGVAADKSPLAGQARPRRPRTFIGSSRVLVAEVEHGGYTESGSLRQAAFKGLREDKTAAEVTQAPQPPTEMGDTKATTTVRSAGKTRQGGRGGGDDLQPRQGAVARRRRPAGDHQGGPGAILRDGGRADIAPCGGPADLDHSRARRDRRRDLFPAPRHGGVDPRLKLIDVKARTPYVAAVDVGGLVAIAQSGGLELHPWGCAPGAPEVPDQITFDLDPDEGLDFADVIAAAKVVKAKIEALGLAVFVKTTGGKGLHVVVPIKTDARSRVTWDQNKAFAKAVAEAIRAEAPDRFTTTLAKKARGGKIFIDYLRNGRMATAVAPWSPRARPGAGIAFPLSWGQVRAGLDPRRSTCGPMRRC